MLKSKSYLEFNFKILPSIFLIHQTICSPLCDEYKIQVSPLLSSQSLDLDKSTNNNKDNRKLVKLIIKLK